MIKSILPSTLHTSTMR